MSKLEKRIKQLEGLSYREAFPSIQFDLVALITEQRKETERLRKLTDTQFETYLEEAEQTLNDPTNIDSTPKRAALRIVLKEKRQAMENPNPQ